MMSYSCGFRETRQLQAAVLQLLTVHDSVCAWYTILALAGCCSFPDLFSNSCSQWQPVRAQYDDACFGSSELKVQACTTHQVRLWAFVPVHRAEVPAFTGSSHAFPWYGIACLKAFSLC